MDRRRAAGALLALAACIACSTAAPTASNQTALELFEGPSEGCYYNFQHYGEGDRIMTNEPCLNCTCHNRMLMCYLKVCPFTKPIGQDCTIEKRADQCCPIVTCPDVPVDLLTSTSTTSPAEYGATGLGKVDKYGCSINGKYFPEGSKVPPTPNKPCEHCYCIRNMTTCVMQECTLHVDGCTPIYHKEVCCPVRYSCDHLEDEMLLLDDMTTTVRPTPGFLLTTTTMPSVTQISQNCVHDDQIIADGALIKTEIACEHCYCMKGDIVCVVQECGTPMENEGKNCTSLPPRQGQCCPDTYICEGDELLTEPTTGVTYEELTTFAPPRRVEGSGYRNEPDEPYTEIPAFEGSGEEHATTLDSSEIFTSQKQTPQIIDETFAPTEESLKPSLTTTEPDKEQNTVPDESNESASDSELLGKTTLAQEATTTSQPSVAESMKDTTESKTTSSDYLLTSEADTFISKDDEFIMTTESISQYTKDESSKITEMKPETETTDTFNIMEALATQPSYLQPSSSEASTVYKQDDKTTTSDVSQLDEVSQPQVTTTEVPKDDSDKDDLDKHDISHDKEDEVSLMTTTESRIEPTSETTSVNPVENEIDEDVLPPGRIPGEGDCLLNGITYKNSTNVPNINNCHSSCKCVSSIIKCDPIICSPPPKHMDNMNDCQPIYDTPDACCPTYICHSRETIPPESHSQMSGTESPKPSDESECHGEECQPHKTKPSEQCNSEDCGPVTEDQEKECKNGVCQNIETSSSTGSPLPKHPEACIGDNCMPVVETCTDGKCESSTSSQTICESENGCQPTESCEGSNCAVGSENTITKDELPICKDSEECKKTDTSSCEGSTCDTSSVDTTVSDINRIQSECKEENCRRKDQSEDNKPPECSGSTCIITQGTEGESGGMTTESAIKDQVYKESTTEMINDAYSKLPESERTPSEETQKVTQDEAITENQDISLVHSTEKSEESETEGISQTVTEKGESYTISSDTHATKMEEAITEIYNKPETDSKEQVTESIKDTMKEILTDSPLATQYDKQPSDLPKEDINYEATKPFEGSTETSDIEPHDQTDKDEISGTSIVKDVTQTQEMSTKPTNILETTSKPLETDEPEQEFTNKQETFTESSKQEKTTIESQEIGNTESQQNVFITESSATLLPEITTEEYVSIPIEGEEVTKEHNKDTDMLAETTTEQSVKIKESSKPHDSKLDETPNVVTEVISTDTTIHELHKDEKTTESTIEDQADLSKPTEIYEAITDKQEYNTMPDEVQEHQLVLVTTDSPLIHATQPSPMEENLITQMHDDIHKESHTTTIPEQFDIKEITTQPSEISITNIEEVTSESTDKHEISSQTVPDKLEEHTDTAIKDIHEVSTLMPEETVQDDTNLKPLDKEPQENDMTTDAILINEAGLGTTISSILSDKEITPKYTDTESGMEPSEQSTANPKIHSTISDESISLHDETEKKTLQTSTSSQVGSEAVTTEYSKQPFEDKNEMPDFTQIGGQTQEPSIDERTLAPTISYTEGYDDSHDTTISVSIDIDKTKEEPQYTTPETVSQFIEKEDVTDDHPEENVTKDIKDEMKGTKEPQEPTESTVLKDMEVQNIVTHASEATTQPQETETKLAVEFQTDQGISSTPTNVIKEDKEQTESPMSLITEPAESIHSEDADHSIIDTTTLIPKETKVSTVEEEKTPDHYYTKPQISYTESPQVTEEHGETENTFESKTPSQTFPEKETKPEISFTTSSQEYTTVKILDIGDKEKTPSPTSSEVSEKIAPTTEYQDGMLTQSPVTKDSEVYPTEVLHESTSVVPVVVSSEESLAPEQEETSTRYPEVYGSITTLSYDHETDTKPHKIPVEDTLHYATDQPQNNVDFTTVDSIISETMKDDHGDTQQNDKLDDVKDSEHSIPTEQTTKYPEIIDKIPDKQTGEPSKQEEYTETTEQHITTEAAIYPEKTVSSDVEIQSSVDLDHEKSTEVQQSSDDKDVTTPIYQDLTTTKEESMPGLPESHLITSDTSTTESSEISSSDENNRRTLLPGLETVQPEQYTTEKQKITELPEITKPQDMEQTGGTSQETSSSSPEMEIDTLVSVIQESDHVTSIPAATERIPTITETVPSYQDQTISVITESIEELTTKEHITSKPETELDVIKDIQTEQPLPIETEKDLPVIPIDKPAEIPSEHTLAQEPQTETSIPKENEISEPVATEASIPADTESDISVPIETISDSKATEPSILKETEYVAIDSSMPHETESAVFEVTEASVPKETEAAVSIVTETSVPEETEASLPEKTDTSLHKIPEVPVSEITETSVSESSEPKTPEVTEASQSEVTEASQPEVTDASQPEVTEASQPEVTEASQPEVTEASQPEVTEASQPEVSEASQPEITEASQPEVTEAPRPKVTELSQPEVTELSQPEVTEVSQPEVTEASQPEVTKASQPEVTETSQPEVTEASQPEVTEASQPKVSEPSVTEIIEVSVTEYSKPKAPEVTEVSQPDITEGSVPEKTKDTESELTSVSATEVTEPSVTEETDISIQKETESGSIYSQGTTYKPKDEKLEAPVEESPTLEPIYSSSETTPYLVELQEHTTKVDEDISSGTLDGKDITKAPEIYHTERGDQPLDNIPDTFMQEDSHEEHTTKENVSKKDEQLSTLPPEQASKVEIATEEVLISSDVPLSTMLNEPVTTQTVSSGEQGMTMSPTVLLPLDEHDKYTTAGFEIETTSDKKDMPLGTEKTPEHEVTDSDDALVPVITKTTTIRTPEEITTHLPVADNTFTKPEGKPSESYSPTTASDLSKPVMNEIQSTEELPSPDFPPSGSSGYGQEPDYVEEDQAFGPGTCRYGGKVYVSAQQIPRDDPCDFCFCFRSDIICLQQSCPPPIHGCHEEPIQGFCCPRYECPVSMATTLNVTTTTTTTTTTLPPHFLPHAYKGAAQRRGCQIKGHSYKVGEVVRASSGPCLHCTCGGDGQMKCDPKACTPEPMLRQMIAAAVSSKRRR